MVLKRKIDDWLADIAAYVEQLFAHHPKACLVYHNLTHTQDVVKHAKQIAAHYSLNEEDQFVLLAAAWFHDTGHLFGEMATHEQISVEVLLGYFAGQQLPQSLLDRMAGCILATKMPPQPESLLEKILCDADTFHLGTADFWRIDCLVWQELEMRIHQPIEKKIEKSILFLERHQFFTDYCQATLAKGKRNNLVHLKTCLGQISS